MKKHLTFLLLTLSVSSASAQYFNNRAVVQGFLKQGTTALNDASGYPMRFVVKRGSSSVWCQTSAAPVPVVGGIFNVILSGSANCNALNNSFSPAIFAHSSNADTFSFDVIVDINKDGFGGSDDATFAGIDIVSSPLAMYANSANNALTAVNATNATNATTATSATNAITAATATTAGNVTGVVAVANGGTGATTASAARTALGLGSVATVNTNGNANQFLKGDGTWGAAGGAAPVTSVAGKTGAVTLTSTDIGGLGTAATMAATAFMQGSNNLSDLTDASAARTNLNAAAAGANTDITSVALTGAGTALTVANDASVGGTLTVTGGVAGNLTGNVSGNVTGNLNGNVTGDVSGVARQANSQVALTTAGSATAYTLTLSPAIAAGPVVGTTVLFKVHATNTGAATLNVDGTGAKNLVSKRTGLGLVAGDLIGNSFVSAVYDGTNWRVDIPNLYFAATALNCGNSAGTNNTVTCPNITAANVNAGDMVHCSPSADPANKVNWSARAAAGSISIRLACSNNNSACTLTNVNWKCVVMK